MTGVLQKAVPNMSDGFFCAEKEEKNEENS